MAGFFSAILGLWGRENSSPKYRMTDVYQGLRDQVFSLNPQTVGLQPDKAKPVWGIMMETGYPEAVVSLLTIADGTVSLYFSNGGGIIGLGQHEAPHKISQELLALVSKSLSDFNSTSDRSLPSRGMTKFYVFTFDGVLASEAQEDDLGNNRHKTSPLFHKAHELITAILSVDEKLNKNTNAPKP